MVNETAFTSATVAMGRTVVEPDHTAWDQPNTTASADVITFPRSAFSVTVAGSPRLLHAGVAVSTPANRPYRRRLIDPKGEQTDWLWISPELADWVAFRRPDWRTDEQWLCRMDGPTLFAQRRLAHAAGRNPNPLEFDEAVVSMLARLLRIDPERRGDSRRSARLSNRALTFLVENTHASPDLAQLARHLGVSLPHLCTVFRQTNGVTMGQFSRFIRLCLTLDAMDRPDTRLTDLAYEAGFSSHSHFSALFRRCFGCTPRHATRLFQEGSVS